MQRIALFLTLALVAGGVPALAAQRESGTELWRLAATTFPVPPALATGGAAAYWNPAQPDGSARFVLGLDAIQTPAAIGASGFLAAGRFAIGKMGRFGVLYGRMEIGDLVHTTLTPDPDGASIPFFSEIVGATWSRDYGSTTLGAMLAHHDSRLDLRRANRWTVDVGASRTFGHVLRLSAATHDLSRPSVSDPAQDLYAGAELRVWRGVLWTGGDSASLVARYGVALAHQFSPDNLFGLGLAIGTRFRGDLLLAHEGSYGSSGWRPAAGVSVAVGKYRVTLARDVGVQNIGSAFRVGLEALIR